MLEKVDNILCSLAKLKVLLTSLQGPVYSRAKMHKVCVSKFKDTEPAKALEQRPVAWNLIMKICHIFTFTGDMKNSFCKSEDSH